jgi:hypothetical protein
MNLKTLALPIFLIAFGFIGFGDRVLPNPLNSLSLNTRTSINQFLLGLSPKIKSQNPDGATEKAVNSIAN